MVSLSASLTDTNTSAQIDTNTCIETYAETRIRPDTDIVLVCVKDPITTIVSCIGFSFQVLV